MLNYLLSLVFLPELSLPFTIPVIFMPVCTYGQIFISSHYPFQVRTDAKKTTEAAKRFHMVSKQQR